MASEAKAQTNFDISGSWQYTLVTNLSYPPPANWVATTVPGYLSTTNYAKAWFRKIFTLPPLPAGDRVILHFGGVKYNSTVYLNGHSLGGCYNGYNPFELDATAFAIPGAANELLIALSDWTTFFSAPVDFSNLQPGESPRDRANNVVLAPIGGNFNLFGIWEPVTVSYVSAVHISDVFVIPSVRQQQLKVRSKVRNDTASTVDVTLESRVMAGTNQVFVMPDQPISVPPGTTLDVESIGTWTSPRLWSPEDPYLYTLESTLNSGFATDSLLTRFGFREFWTAGDSFFLNGTRMHLLATACWPPTTQTSDATIRKSLSEIKAGNNKAIRFHTQPWPEAWYQIADELGLLVVEEAAVWCDPRAYRLSDPVFWTNYADHLRAAVKRDQNHPSIVMWSLENEILHCGGDQIFSGTITNLAALGGLVKSLDPSRPITFEADLDPGGVADVLGLHYPHEYPDFADWPNTTYWMGNSIPKSYSPGGQWRWDHSKPLYIGEHLWIADTVADVFTILFGDAAYFDPSRYRQLAKAWTWQMQIEAYRAYDVSAHCPWSMIEDPAAAGIQDLNTNQNLYYKTQAAAYHPNAAVPKEYSSHFFTGENIQRTIATYNDTSSDGQFQLQWRVNGTSGSHTLSIPAGTQTVDTISFPAPAAPGPFPFELKLLNQGVTVFSNSLPYAAYSPTPISWNPGRRVAIYDPTGTTTNLFSGLTYQSLTNLATAPYSQLDLIIVGRNALQPETVPVLGTNTVGTQWQAFMEKGGRILLLEQTTYPWWMPLGLSLVNEPANFAFPASNHPIATNLTAEDLRWWRDDNMILRAALRVTSYGNCNVVAYVGAKSGLDRAALLEVPVGRGGLLCSQFLIAERFNSEPMSRVLLQRMLDYTGPSTLQHYAGILTQPNSPELQALQRVGFIGENLQGHLATADLRRFPVLLLAGNAAAWNEATTNLSLLQTFVENGGKLVVHRPPDTFLSVAAPLFLQNATWSTNISVPILRSDITNGAGRFANHDLYWADDPGSWNRPLVLATNIATRVYRKNFTVASYVALQVETMPIHTSGSGLPGAWNLNANGYAAQNINITQGGAYLFAVTAKGTPVAGGFPHMLLRIDGNFADAVTVSTTNYSSFTLSAVLSPGIHELALVFDNDAYAPPEDRNLYLDEVRYGLDSSPDSPIFWTRPGAVVETKRNLGKVIFDEIAWENPGMHAARAERYLSSLLTSEGVLQTMPAGLRMEAERMRSVGVAAGTTNNGIVWLWSSGQLETTVRFTEAGSYAFDIVGYGTPAQGIFPRAALLIDGANRGTVELIASQPTSFTIFTNVTAGVHTIALSFINDFYAPPEDRNLALDSLTIRPQVRPQIIEMNLPPGGNNSSVVWLAQPGKTYDLEATTSLSSPWISLGSTTPTGTAASFIDDGVVLGQPPNSPGRPVTLYRIRQRP